MKVEYHPDTVNDLNEAVSYYNERVPGLGDDFRSEIYETISRIVERPQQHRTIQ